MYLEVVEMGNRGSSVLSWELYLTELPILQQIGSRHVCVLKFVCQRIQLEQIQVEKPVGLSDHLGWRSHRQRSLASTSSTRQMSRHLLASVTHEKGMFTQRGKIRAD